MLYSKELQVKYETDVFIAGGGPAGVAAAIAAARNGAKVFLAEARGSLGGLGTVGFVPAFATFSDGENLVASGIGLEIRKKVSKNVPLESEWTPIRIEELKRAYDDAVIGSGAELSFFTSLCDVKATDGKVDYVVLTSKTGMFAVKAKIYIDCTGDGDLCALAGGKFELGDQSMNTMPTTLCSIWSNIDFPKKENDSKYLKKAIEDGVFTYPDLHLPGMSEADTEKGIGGGNIGHIFGTDPLDERSLTKAMVWGRKSMLEYERYYKEYLSSSYKNLNLVATSDMLGVRDSRRISCDYTLSANDFTRRAVFDDEIGRYCYPVDIHVNSTDPKEYDRFSQEYHNTFRYKPGESYGIPYRSLIPVSFSNVLVAGRCIGCDRQMQASVRVMPGCFITGQAAGVAAALAKDTCDTRKVDVFLLQTKLKDLGAYLPNAK